MIGRSGRAPGTVPRKVSYSSIRVLDHNRPHRRPRRPALAPNKLVTNFFDDKPLQEHREAFLSATGDTDVTGRSEKLGKARTANLSQSRAIGQRFMFVRAMIGRCGWPRRTRPRTVSYSSTRLLHHNQPQRRLRLLARAPNKPATDAGRRYNNEKTLSSSPRKIGMLLATLRNPKQVVPATSNVPANTSR